MEALSIYAPQIAITNLIAGVVGFLFIKRTQPHQNLVVRMILGVPCLASMVLVVIAAIMVATKPSEDGVAMKIRLVLVVGLLFAAVSLPGAWIGGALGAKMRPRPVSRR